jgi:serine/threonine protein kinase
VDVWSIGCIMYTLLCGRPPFETSNIESTYKKIKSNDYRFPSTVRISDDSRELIKMMLAARPEDRPTLTQVRYVPLFTNSNSSFPSRLARHQNHCMVVMSELYAHTPPSPLTLTDSRVPLHARIHPNCASTFGALPCT